jgi:hypothetical protein
MPPRFPDPDAASKRAPYRDPAGVPAEAPSEPHPTVVRRPTSSPDDPSSPGAGRRPLAMDREEIRSLAELAREASPAPARSVWRARLVAIPLLAVALAFRSTWPWPVVAAIAVAGVIVLVAEARRRR